MKQEDRLQQLLSDEKKLIDQHEKKEQTFAIAEKKLKPNKEKLQRLIEAATGEEQIKLKGMVDEYILSFDKVLKVHDEERVLFKKELTKIRKEIKLLSKK